MKSNKESNLNFEDEQGISNSIRLLKSEFIVKAIKATIYLSIIIVICIGYIFLQPRLTFVNHIYIANYSPYSIKLTLTVGWTLFSTSIFLICYIIKYLQVKFTPSIIKYMKEELNYLGYDFQKKYSSGLLFVLLNSLSIILMTYTDLEVFVFNNTIQSILFRNLIIGYLFFSLALPIIWLGLNDKYVIKIKENFYILFDFHFSLRKRHSDTLALLGITLSSNRLCSRFNKPGKHVHTRICQIRWLPRTGTKIKNYSPYLHFHEFSVPVNLQKQVLNVILALREWDENYEKEVNLLRYNLALSQNYRDYLSINQLNNLFMLLFRA